MARIWQEVARETLDAIDIAVEFKAMGIETTGTMGATGWVSCRVYGDAEDHSPSAGINVGDVHPQRGRYKIFKGLQPNFSFWEFCVIAGKFSDWVEAREHYRKIHKIKGPTGSAKEPHAQIEIQKWNDALVAGWCSTKPPVAPWAVRHAGGCLATWPAKSKRPNTVIALPVYGPNGADDMPQGWVIYPLSGMMLPLWQGEGLPYRDVDMLSVGGSKAGWMNRHGLHMIEKAEVVWKVEGPSDMLALQSRIPKELLRSHAVITNSNGSGELPRDEYLAILKGKVVNVVHDADDPGVEGGKIWAEAIAGVAKEVRRVDLPFPVVKKHGKDLRDWFLEKKGVY